LTERQAAVVRLLSLGLTQKAVGAELGISAKTVDWHRRAAVQRLLLPPGILPLIQWAVDAGLRPPIVPSRTQWGPDDSAVHAS
jgi:DNA-binding NarL/FixJ family response regulator